MPTVEIPIEKREGKLLIVISEKEMPALQSLLSSSSSEISLAEAVKKSDEAKILLAEIKEDIKSLRPGVMEEYLRLAGKDRFVAIGQALGFLQEEVHVAEEVSQGKDSQAEKDQETGPAAADPQVRSVKIVR